jgi:hypothetical protein
LPQYFRLPDVVSGITATAKHPENTDQAIVTRARNADLFEIPLLWVVGDAKKAEESSKE